MKLGIIINTNNPETAWNALRLGSTALDEGHKVSVFLIGSGVEIEKIKDDRFNVTELLKKFTRGKVNLLGCSTCMGLRHQGEAGVILKSTLTDLMKIIAESDKVVTFG
ncbi:MAG: DsrE family protein [Dehalococcoidia bacterium]|nr:DsrE family protein [Dehalococcoidia bacterium]